MVANISLNVNSEEPDTGTAIGTLKGVLPFGMSLRFPDGQLPERTVDAGGPNRMIPALGLLTPFPKVFTLVEVIQYTKLHSGKMIAYAAFRPELTAL